MPKKSVDGTSEPTIDKLSNKQDEQFIDSGMPELNELMGGGIARGRITELWGADGSGKTHLATMIMANNPKLKILFIDAEFSFNAQRAAALGVNNDNVDYMADARLERVCELLVKAVGKYDLIILDSLAYLTPQTVDSNEIGETSIGLYARLLKHWIVKFRPRLGVSKTAFIAANQYRAPIGMYVKPESPGGKAWQHAIDVKLYLTTNQGDKIMQGTERIGHWLHLESKKNKLSPPYRSVKIKIMY